MEVSAMNETPFRVQHIDHIEFFVPDQYEAAGWYRRVLGLEIVAPFEQWAAAGPLMISSDGGRTMLALFRGQPRGDRPTAGFHRVAFRVDGAGFLQFIDRLDEIELSSRDGSRLSAGHVVDHEQSWSIYFQDPYGHLLEVTTYDYAGVRDGLSA
jgi:catechol 2,3-dioxygenase-like lactoylglutathione lyase family enzyme